MSNEFDVWAKLVEIAEGSTALVNLCDGEENPLRKWEDIGKGKRPIVGGRIDDGRLLGGSHDPFLWRLTLDVFVEFDSTGLAAAIGDVLEDIINFTNLNSTGGVAAVDVAPTLRNRFPLPEVDEGRDRLTLQWGLRHNR